MASFLELQTQVRAIVIDLPTAVTNSVPSFINMAMRELQNKHDFKVMEVISGPHTTVVSSPSLASVPSNFKAFRGKPYLVERDGKTRNLEILPDLATAYRAFGSSVGGDADVATLQAPPRAILHNEDSDEAGTATFGVYPIPDGLSLYSTAPAGEYRIYIPYWRYVTTLSADADSNWFTVNAEHWLIRQAASEAFFRDWDEARGTLWAQRAQEKYMEVVKQDKRYRFSTVGTLVPSPDAYGTPMQGERRG